VIHYHGLPITPATAAVAAISGGHAFVSYAHRDQLSVAMECAQSFALDNGAFSAWKSGYPIDDWSGYYEWVNDVSRHPGFDWAVIPDVIDGSDSDNDALLSEFPDKRIGVPVWHLGSSLDRLARLAADYGRICFGSSGEFAVVGTPNWWQRISKAMNVICDRQGRPMTKLHGLRMLDPEIFTRIPLASADSTNIARNIGIDSAWKGTYTPPTKESRAQIIRSRIETHNSAGSWIFQPTQDELCLF